MLAVDHRCPSCTLDGCRVADWQADVAALIPMLGESLPRSAIFAARSSWRRWRFAVRLRSMPVPADPFAELGAP